MTYDDVDFSDETPSDENHPGIERTIGGTRKQMSEYFDPALGTNSNYNNKDDNDNDNEPI